MKIQICFILSCSTFTCNLCVSTKPNIFIWLTFQLVECSKEDATYLHFFLCNPWATLSSSALGKLYGCAVRPGNNTLYIIISFIPPHLHANIYLYVCYSHLAISREWNSNNREKLIQIPFQSRVRENMLF